MKCEVCQLKIPKENHNPVCSNKCTIIRNKIINITDKYFPTVECCECKRELAREFGKDLGLLIRLIYL